MSTLATEGIPIGSAHSARDYADELHFNEFDQIAPYTDMGPAAELTQFTPCEADSPRIGRGVALFSGGLNTKGYKPLDLTQQLKADRVEIIQTASQDLSGQLLSDSQVIVAGSITTTRASGTLRHQIIFPSGASTARCPYSPVGLRESAGAKVWTRLWVFRS